MGILDQYRDFLAERGIEFREWSILRVIKPTAHLKENYVELTAWGDEVTIHCWVCGVQLSGRYYQEDVMDALNDEVPGIHWWYDHPDIVGYYKLTNPTVEELHEKVLWAIQKTDEAYVAAEEITGCKLDR